MKYKSEIFKTIHQDAVADYKIGAISEERMREYDNMCLNKITKPLFKNKSIKSKKLIPATV